MIKGNKDEIKDQESFAAKPALMSGGISRHHTKQKLPPGGSLSQRPSFGTLIVNEEFRAA
jgi:hypothetical protein